VHALEAVVAARDVEVERGRGADVARGRELHDGLVVLALVVERGAGGEVALRDLGVGILDGEDGLRGEHEGEDAGCDADEGHGLQA
jgi:hypothetical protein